MKVFFLYPGKLETLSGGYIYDRRIIEGLQSLDMDVHHFSLSGGFPFPDLQTQNKARSLMEGLAEGSPLVIDGLAFGVLDSQTLEAIADKHPLIALIHHPLALETGLQEAQAQTLYKKEKTALTFANAVIVTGKETKARLISDYDVPEQIIRVIVPGNDPAPLAVGSAPPQFVTVGALIPRKGHMLLLDAFEDIKDLDWSWVVVGDESVDPELSKSFKKAIIEKSLRERINVLGKVSQTALDAAYHKADCFALPSFHEGYGMAFSEALVRGLPVIATTAGAITNTVPEDASILVLPGDRQALAHALRTFLKNTHKRTSLKKAAKQHRKRYPTWQDSAQAFAKVLEDTCYER